MILAITVLALLGPPMEESVWDDGCKDRRWKSLCEMMVTPPHSLSALLGSSRLRSCEGWISSLPRLSATATLQQPVSAGSISPPEHVTRVGIVMDKSLMKVSTKFRGISRDIVGTFDCMIVCSPVSQLLPWGDPRLVMELWSDDLVTRDTWQLGVVPCDAGVGRVSLLSVGHTSEIRDNR